jgi:hypothetical protein
MTNNRKKRSEEKFIITNFNRILTVFTNLTYLYCHPVFESDQPLLSFEEKTPIFFSSALLELHINVASLSDCLYLLDGRLNQLRTFHIDIDFVGRPSSLINQKASYLGTFKLFLLTFFISHYSF